MMKRMLLFVCCAVLLCGCGKTTSPSKKVEGEDLSKMEKAMLGADTTLPEMIVVRGTEEDAELNFTALSDLDYDRVEDYFYAYAKDGSASEIAVVRMKDVNDITPMMDSINKHLKTRRGTMEEYKPEQVELIDKAVVTYEGNDVALIVSEKNGLVQKEFVPEKKK